MTLRTSTPTRVVILLTALLGFGASHLYGAERSNINITGYVIDAQLDPAEHRGSDLRCVGESRRGQRGGGRAQLQCQ